MSLSRISDSIDTSRMRKSHVTSIGGAWRLLEDLARSNLGSATLIDFDRVSASNLHRQDFLPSEVCRGKAAVWAKNLRRLSPRMRVDVRNRDFCSLWPDELDPILDRTDLIIAAVDFFPAAARACRLAVERGIPILCMGMYRAARAAEIVHYVPGTTPACPRCVLSKRYESFHRGGLGVTPSQGGTIHDLRLLDAVAGQLAVAILTRGADNRFGRLIRQLDDRNLIQIKIDPGFLIGNRDIFAEHLGDTAANFSFTTIALSMAPEAGCPDCGAAAAHHTEDTTCESTST